MLVNAGAEVDKKLIGNWRCGQTALHIAASRGHFESVKFLADSGAEIDCADCDGRTPLIFAAMRGYDQATEVLLSAGANVLHQDYDGLTALDYLVKYYNDFQEYIVDEETVQKWHCTMVHLVTWGDRNWNKMPPVPCLGLERALVTIWKEEPKALPQLFKKLEKGMQIRIQSYLRILHHILPQEELRMEVLAIVLKGDGVRPLKKQINESLISKIFKNLRVFLGIKPSRKVNRWI